MFDYDNAEQDILDAGGDPDYLNYYDEEERDSFLEDMGMNPEDYGGHSSDCYDVSLDCDNSWMGIAAMGALMEEEEEMESINRSYHSSRMPAIIDDSDDLFNTPIEE